MAAAAGKENFGTRGLYVVAAVSGLTDMDAITLSVSDMVEKGQVGGMTGWRLVLTGALSNLVFKSGIIAVLGNKKLVGKVLVLFGVTFCWTLGVMMLGKPLRVHRRESRHFHRENPCFLVNLVDNSGDLAKGMNLSDISWESVKMVSIDQCTLRVTTDLGVHSYAFNTTEELSEALLILSLSGTKKVEFTDEARFNPARFLDIYGRRGTREIIGLKTTSRRFRA